MEPSGKTYDMAEARGWEEGKRVGESKNPTRHGHAWEVKEILGKKVAKGQGKLGPQVMPVGAVWDAESPGGSFELPALPHQA